MRLNKNVLLALALLVIGVIGLTVRVASHRHFWCCSNHKAAHVAFTVDEIAENTVRFGCKGWHQE